MPQDDQWVPLLLPSEIRRMDRESLIREIREIKAQYKEKMAILAHHYQKDEIVELADKRGDSLELARYSARLKKAKYIIFCGVAFMVEAAAILCREDQKVYFPAPDAGCPLADMAEEGDVKRAWGELSRILDVGKIIPITYVNSPTELKAFCGERGGIVCTSSNADKIMEWAFQKGEKILFMPDENLGRNTCNALGMQREEVIVWNPQLDGGGCDKDAVRKAKAILWKGFCHVHLNFTAQQVKMARENYPGCRIIVHPECQEDVVNLSDAAGSTSRIIQYVEESPPESAIVIGTESNLVKRLAKEHPDKTIVELSHSECPDMARVTLRNLHFVMKYLGDFNVVEVEEPIASHARLALERMLEVK
ncbi:quinolinate synthase NadA [Candidatus Sumerlaeota bacterium]|nr:quinolinate synthase NadA [Candidatus Sumerlaeota bacterium]